MAVARTLVRCAEPSHAHAPYALAVVVPSYTSACEPSAENTSIVHESHEVPSTRVAEMAPTDRRGRIPSLPGSSSTSRLMAGHEVAVDDVAGERVAYRLRAVDADPVRECCRGSCCAKSVLWVRSPRSDTPSPLVRPRARILEADVVARDGVEVRSRRGGHRSSRCRR